MATFKEFKELVDSIDNIYTINSMIKQFDECPIHEKTQSEYNQRLHYLKIRKDVIESNLSNKKIEMKDLNGKIIKDGSDAHMEQETYPMFDLSIKKDVDTDINGAKYQAIRDAKNLLPGIGKNVFKMEIKKSHFDQEAINETGNRFNEGKLRWSLLDLKYLEGLVQVLMMGAIKYSDFNWQKGLPTIEVYESLMRHVIAWKSGEDKDAESGLDHIDHAICNLYFIKWMIANKPQFDTRKKVINEQDFEERKYPNENEK